MGERDRLGEKPDWREKLPTVNETIPFAFGRLIKEISESVNDSQHLELIEHIRRSMLSGFAQSEHLERMIAEMVVGSVSSGNWIEIPEVSFHLREFDRNRYYAQIVAEPLGIFEHIPTNIRTNPNKPALRPSRGLIEKLGDRFKGDMTANVLIKPDLI